MAGRSHGGRLEEGRRLLAAAALVDTRSVAARLAKFKRAHQQYESLTGKVDKAERPYATQIAAIGEADAAQDVAVEALARALVGDGGARTNPFKAFGAPSPSELAAKGYAAEAKDALKLVKAVRGKKDASKATTAAAGALEKAAKSVQSAMVGVDKHKKPLAAARAARDAAALAWETTYAALRRGAKAAEDDGAKGLATRLFGGAAKPAKRATKRGAAAPAPGGGGATPAGGDTPTA
ncbi:MAG: hypothetical protein IT379_32150 [Deltaproteobacteria bacterium]|nr:hypothetical protein [Deltaproteobacteria bacterium]